MRLNHSKLSAPSYPRLHYIYTLTATAITSPILLHLLNISNNNQTNLNPPSPIATPVRQQNASNYQRLLHLPLYLRCFFHKPDPILSLPCRRSEWNIGKCPIWSARRTNHRLIHSRRRLNGWSIITRAGNIRVQSRRRLTIIRRPIAILTRLKSRDLLSFNTPTRVPVLHSTPAASITNRTTDGEQDCDTDDTTANGEADDHGYLGVLAVVVRFRPGIGG
jgi:hypothetical protein